MEQFDSFKASSLYCPKCRMAQPVFERLLLVLPGSEIYDIRCRACATSVGQREAKAPPLSAQMAAPRATKASAAPGMNRRANAGIYSKRLGSSRRAP